MNVLFINPPRLNEVIGNNPEVIEEKRGLLPPLGLLYLAAAVEEGSPHRASVLDAQAEGLGYAEVERRVRQASPDVVGITAMTLALVDVVRTVEAVKRAAPSAKTVIGGPHVYLYPEETLSLPGVDYLVLGEGERVFVELLSRLEIGQRPNDVKGLAFLDEGGDYINTGPAGLIDDLDSLPFPARRLVPLEKYYSVMAKRTPVTSIITSRGCPFACTFCNRPHLGKRFRPRSAKNVADEFEACAGMGIKEIMVYDDTFTVDRQRVLDICGELMRRDLDVTWDIRARVSTVDTEMLNRLKAARCERIHYGVEAGTDKVLRNLSKGVTVEMVKEVFRATKRAGISTLGYFMLGCPGETAEDVEATMRLMRELDPDYVHITILTPFPGTRLYADALSKGLVKGDVWREFARRPGADFVPPHWGENFTREELTALLSKAYRRFYLRPGYIARGLAQVSSVGELRRKVSAGLKVLTSR